MSNTGVGSGRVQWKDVDTMVEVGEYQVLENMGTGGRFRFKPTERRLAVQLFDELIPLAAHSVSLVRVTDVEDESTESDPTACSWNTELLMYMFKRHTVRKHGDRPVKEKVPSLGDMANAIDRDLVLAHREPADENGDSAELWVRLA